MEMTVETAGIGVYKTGHHYDRMYLDDIIDGDTILSDTESENAMRFESELIPMKIDPGGLIFQYGTKWGAGDLYDWICDRINTEEDSEDKLDWRFIHREVMEEIDVFHKYSEIDNAEWDKRTVYDKEDAKWKAFIYSYFNEDILDKKRSEAGNDFFFTAQYFNRIIGKDRLVFPPPYVEVSQDDFPKDLDYILTIDPAFVPSKTSDFTALVVCGYNEENKIYVAEAIRNKANPSELLEKIYGLYRQYEFRIGGMEKGSWEIVMDWVLEYARKEQGLPRLPLTGIQVSNLKDAKDQRIRAMSYFFKCGAVVLRYGLDDLKRELGKYPGNTRSKNDLVDALSMQRKLRSWKMQKSVATEGAELDEYKKSFRSYNFGFNRKPAVGYVSY
jgi:predicted phage terminase large subunit-like protein